MLVNRRLQLSTVLDTAGSTFAKNMRRASLFTASSASKAVPKQEPCRGELNDSVRAFDALSGEHTRLAISHCLPGEADLLAPAVDEARRSLLGFATATAEESVDLMITTAGILLPERRPWPRCRRSRESPTKPTRRGSRLNGI